MANNLVEKMFLKSEQSEQIAKYLKENAFYDDKQCSFVLELLNTICNAQSSQEEKAMFLDFIQKHPWSFWGKFEKSDHITASALVLNEQEDSVLLTDHKKFGRWFHLGGHWCDYEPGTPKVEVGGLAFPNHQPLEAALREVSEEGFNNEPFEYEMLMGSEVMDLDVHIAGNHKHYDICYILKQIGKKEIVCSEESVDLKWIKIEDVLNKKMIENKKGEIHQIEPRILKFVNKLLAWKNKQEKNKSINKPQ